MIRLYRGQRRDGELLLCGDPLASITGGDFNALWREIGIDVDSWSPDIRRQDKGFPYPHIYAIQNYIVYEHQCLEVEALRLEAAQLQHKIHGSASKRALDVLLATASMLASEGRGIIFRPGIAEP